MTVSISDKTHYMEVCAATPPPTPLGLCPVFLCYYCRLDVLFCRRLKNVCSYCITVHEKVTSQHFKLCMLQRPIINLSFIITSEKHVRNIQT